MPTLLAAGVLLSACGGGGDAEHAPAAGVVAVPATASASASVSVSALAPVSASASKMRTLDWQRLWGEPWLAPTVGGWVHNGGPECDRRPDDGSTFEEQPAAATWRAVGPVPPLTTHGGELVVDQVQFTGGGWALVSGRTFEPDVPLRLSAAVALEPEDGAWAGLALIQRSSRYREIALRWDGGRLLVQRYTPCEITTLAEVEPGPRLLKLEYLPEAGWRYLVDGRLLLEEPISAEGAAFSGPVRAGLFVVHVGAEAGVVPAGRQRLRVGTMRVERRGE